MDERVRGAEGVGDQARPIGCPWQVLCYKTHTVDCRLQIAQRAPDQRCQQNCDMYTHLTEINTALKETKEDLHAATCEKRAAETHS